MVPIWHISVIYHHAIDQWFLARWLDLPPWGLKIIFELCICVFPNENGKTSHNC